MGFITLPASQLPTTFRYPKAFHEFCQRQPAADLRPWYIFDDTEDLDFWWSTVREWYPARNLIPFARDYSHGDDIACFDGADTTGDPMVHFVHCFATAGWEDRGNVENFSLWEKVAEEEHAEYLTREVEE